MTATIGFCARASHCADSAEAPHPLLGISYAEREALARWRAHFRVADEEDANILPFLGLPLSSLRTQTHWNCFATQESAPVCLVAADA